MNIGKEQRVYIVEPLEDPVPQRAPERVETPARPRPCEPPREPAKV